MISLHEHFTSKTTKFEQATCLNKSIEIGKRRMKGTNDSSRKYAKVWFAE